MNFLGNIQFIILHYTSRSIPSEPSQGDGGGSETKCDGESLMQDNEVYIQLNKFILSNIFNSEVIHGRCKVWILKTDLTVRNLKLITAIKPSLLSLEPPIFPILSYPVSEKTVGMEEVETCVLGGKACAPLSGTWYLVTNLPSGF
jgi:hypothetical protein